MKFLRSFLIFLVAVELTLSTFFNTVGTLACPLYKKWCYHVAMYEEDSIGFFNDEVGVSGVQCVQKKKVVYNLTGEQNGDGLYNNFYEIAIIVTHNCTGQWFNIRRIYSNITYASVTDKEVFNTWDAELSNDGERVPDYNY
ncbi:hypothetical protein GCK72_022917 [Caenorhabditis remanei]|uniref:Uncharacterized protein n=1 Tax=Caenorhabditis remanei TaxID=31234 RepID=A0A6A5FVL6_CAERE|nr:hypothetical protein GCK72_022917 [Caenorhabditis remanei]KAF1746461.1 hypothetical protein GCK72_022917 [Caenorhabditis remanei]